VSRSLAILIDSLDGGGAERSVLTIAGALQARGVDVELFVLSERVGYDDLPSVPVHVVPNAGEHLSIPFDQSAATLRDCVAEVEQRRGAPFDLFFANLPQSWELAVEAGLEPTYHFIRNSFNAELRNELRRSPRRYLRLRRRLAKLSGRNLIAISDGLRHDVESSRFLRPASLRRIYNPFPIERIRALARESVDGLPDEPYVIHVGRGSRQKRQDILFRAFRRVPEPYRLVCLSRNSKRLRVLAKRYGISDRVITPGFQQNPHAWVANARLSVLSSDYEGLSRVVIESLICGTPVVSTRCPHGPEEILGEELAHWLVPPRRPDLLGAKIAEALETEIDLSRWWMLKEIDSNTVADQLLSLFDKP